MSTTRLSKPAAMALGLTAALTAAALAQGPGKPGRSASPASARETIALTGLVEFIERSNVSPLTDGVIHKMEVTDGDEVKEDGTIGILHDEKAKATVAKAALVAQNVGPIRKAQAQTALARADLSRYMRIRERGANFVSEAEVEKAVAEVKVGEAMLDEAKENREVAKAELAIAEQIEAEHTITAPFDGIVIKRHKHPGEAVRSNEPVITLGKIDRLRFIGWVAVDQQHRIKPGMVVDLQPNVVDSDLPIEKKRFRGKVKAVGTEIQVIGRTEVKVIAEVSNNELKELHPGYKANLTVYLQSLEDPNSYPAEPEDMLRPAAKTDVAEKPGRPAGVK